MKAKETKNNRLFKRPALMLCALAALCLAITAVLSASPTYAVTQSVNTWADFCLALLDPTVDVIELTGNIARPDTTTGTRPPNIARSLTIKSDMSQPGSPFTINFGNENNAAAGVGLLAAPAGTVLRLEDFNFIKHGTTTSAASRSRNAFSGTEANTANWTIEIKDITSGKATNQEGLIVAQGASVFVEGTQNELYIEADARNHFDVRHFEMTAGSKMELYTRELTKNGTTAGTRGGSDTNICINGNGTVMLRQDAALSIWNYGSSNTQSDRGSNGILGTITDLTLEPRSKLDIFTANIGYWTTIQNSLTMTGGAVFNATTVGYNTGGRNAQCAIALCRDLSDTNNGFPATILIDGEGTEVNIYSTNNDTGVSGGAWAVKGPGSVMTVTNGAKLSSHSTESTALVFQGANSVFNVNNGAEVYFRQDASPNNITSTLRFRLTGDFTFNVDGGKIQVDQFDPTGNPAIRMFGGNNFINVTKGGQFKVFSRGDGTQRNGTSDSQNQGIQYTGTTSGSTRNGFYSSGRDANGNPSVIEIIAPFGPAIIGSSYPMTVEASDGAVFVAHGRTASNTAGAIANSGASNYLSFTLDNPLYFDIRNYSTVSGGAPAVYSETNAANATNNFIALTNSDFSIWARKSPVGGSQNAYFESSPTRAWTMLTFLVNGRWMHYVATPDPPHFLSPNPFFNGTSPTAPSTNVSAQECSRISANNAPPVIDALRTPTDADKYLHGHTSVMEGVYGYRDGWTDEIYVTVQVKDAGGNIVPIRDMHGNYGPTAEWPAMASAYLNPDGVTITVYDDAPDGGVIKIPYIPQNPAAHAYVPYDYLPAPVQGDTCFLPAGYAFEVLEAYRSSAGSKTEQLAAVPPDPKAPRVHQSNYSRDIAGVLIQNQGSVYAACIDKTPPQPAEIDGEIDDTPKLTIPEGSAAISGSSPGKTGAYALFALKRGPGDFEVVTADGTPAGSGGVPVTGAVNGATGLWEITVPGHLTLTLGDVIQVYLVDSAGNANGKDSREFHDALFLTDDYFPAGTIAHVVESAFILHIRQVVHNPGSAAMRSWPSEGYTKITDQRSNLSIAPKRYNLVTTAGFSNAAEYTTVELKGVFRHNTVTFQNVIPQYFTLAGYQISSAAPVSLAAPAPGNSIPVDADREYWVTVFVSPASFDTPHHSGGVVDHHFGPVRPPL